MGIVKKQVYKNTITSYLGIIIGYVNMVMLYPVYLSTAQIGLFQLLISMGIFYSLISALGAPGIIVRFFPYYRTDDRRHHGFIHWIGLISLAGFVLCTLFFFMLKPLITSAYTENASLFVDYYYYVIPLGLFTVFFNFFEAVGKVAYQTVYSSLLRDVVLRLLTTLSILAYAQKWLSFEQVVIVYVAFNGIICLLLLISIWYSGKFSLKLPPNNFEEIKHKEVLNYGAYTFFAGIVYVLLQKIDILMISSMASLSIQGVYSIFFSIAMIITVPAQALSRTTYQLVADSWKENDLENVKSIYYKTSVIQMVIGSLLFIGVIINRDNLLMILKGPEYGEQFTVFILIGLSFMVDITGGLNSHIISVSNKYRLGTIVTVISSVTCIILNYFLIPLWGGVGAALSYLIVVAGMNFFNWLYIKQKFKMQPFSKKHVIVVLITVLCYFVGAYFWRVSGLYMDILVRSSLVTAIFASLIYLCKVSPDINEKIDEVLRLKK